MSPRCRTKTRPTHNLRRLQRKWQNAIRGAADRAQDAPKRDSALWRRGLDAPMRPRGRHGLPDEAATEDAGPGRRFVIEDGSLPWRYAAFGFGELDPCAVGA